MLRSAKGSRRYNTPVILAFEAVHVDEYGDRATTEINDVLKVYASVERMSATRSMETFQSADIIGVDVEFRTVPGIRFNVIKWDNHVLRFAEPEAIQRTGITRVNGWYQIDNPKA